MAHIDDPQTQKANMDYIRNAMDEPLLDKDHERDLLERWSKKKDERALHELTRAHMRLVVSLASRFRNYGLPMGDLIQEGNIGLMQAAERFDIERDVRFSTYASWWIRSSIQDYVLRNWSIVRTGTTAAQKSLFFNLRKLRAKIESRNEREGLNDNDRQEIAKDLKVKVKDVADMEARLSGSDPSLNNKIGEEENSEWQDLLADEGPTPEELVTGKKDAQTRSLWLNKALKTLSERERKIIKDRHLGYETVTLEELGKDLGISKERVRQLEQRAMTKLKDTMNDYIGDRSDLF
ncbi:MAG: RNA polymerase factor sigma-32 [Alphaproteobacteria bacterium]|nr:RNA polymerase factor sigma-32 [Alphaproteobacteria bacterium]